MNNSEKKCFRKSFQKMEYAFPVKWNIYYF